MAYTEHHRQSDSLVVRCAIITLSDTRDESTDSSGRMIREMLLREKHSIELYQVIKDEPAELEKMLNDLFARPSLDAIITNGGTGISRRDQTVSVVQRLIDQPLPGFGELFRMLSWEQIGSGAMLSRAMGGVARGKLLFALPGSTAAVELAMSKLILPELKHLVSELKK